MSDFKTRFKSRKILIRRDWNPSIKNAEKKVLIGSKVVFHKGAKRSKYRFFLLLLLRILLGKSFYMLSDSKFLKIILIGQISSHRCAINLAGPVPPDCAGRSRRIVPVGPPSSVQDRPDRRKIGRSLQKVEKNGRSSPRSSQVKSSQVSGLRTRTASVPTLMLSPPVSWAMTVILGLGRGRNFSKWPCYRNRPHGR